MSLKEVNLQSVTRNQYLYKLKAYSNLVYGLILAQMLGLLFSLGGIGGSTASNESLIVSIKYFSGDLVIIFSLLWIFANGLWLPTKQYKRVDFTLISNRSSSNLSNFGILLTASIFAGLTSTLVGSLLRYIIYFTMDRSYIVADGFFMILSDLSLGVVVTIFYMVLFAALGYFIGVLTQVHIAFIIIMPAIFLALIRMSPDYFAAAFQFFASEVSLGLFILKIIVTSVALFGLSIILSNRMEVTR